MRRNRARSIIRPELSAQGIRKNPNPMLPKVFDKLRANGSIDNGDPLVIDCGCGQLRNLKALLSLSSRLVLVDTPYQLESVHDFYGKKLCVQDFVQRKWPDKRIKIVSSSEFDSSRLDADLIFIINVLDVTPRDTRTGILDSCFQNLKPKGRLVVIAPRNDAWTMKICTPDKKYQDGFAFPHRRGYTYYRNWPGTFLQSVVSRSGFRVTDDLSVHRQVCMICEKRP